MKRRLQSGIVAIAVWAALVAGAQPSAAQAPRPAPVAGLTAADKAEGAQAHASIIQEFGGKVEGPVAEYVRRVGLKVALAASPRSSPSDWTFTVLNSPVPNAMATPGGYVYITRGLLAMINSEAELASVLGHEAGHVAARHSDKRNSRATVAGIGSILAGVLLGGDGARLANTVGSGIVASYSRSQEYEADQLGLRYAAAAGYDPRAAPSMLAALERVSTVEGRESMERGGLQSIFASHPVTRERVDRVAALAAEMPPGGVENEANFLSAIDGLAFGDSADQGVVRGTAFRHAGLGFGFDAPAGFRLQNSPRVVVGIGPGGAQFQFQGVSVRPDDSLEAVTNAAWSSLLQGQRVPIVAQPRRINQIEALQTSASASSGGRAVALGITAYRFSPDTVYLITTMEPGGRGQLYEPLLGSVRRLSPAEKREASSGRKIRVVTVGAGDTVATLAAQMAPPYNRAESLLALNGIDAADVRPGRRIKLIVD
jgi:predicted Zn-dependent protease